MKLTPSKSRNIERYTPAWIFEGLGVYFDLDPCAPITKCPSKDWCNRFYSKERNEDGLSLAWYGMVWLNPPWQRGEKAKWISKLYQHGNGIALCRGGVDSKWLHNNPPSTMLLFNKRVGYLSEGCKEFPTRVRKSFGGFEPSMLLAYGPEADSVLLKARLDGIKVRVL